jgi:hypothetical protein
LNLLYFITGENKNNLLSQNNGNNFIFHFDSYRLTLPIMFRNLSNWKSIAFFF